MGRGRHKRIPTEGAHRAIGVLAAAGAIIALAVAAGGSAAERETSTSRHITPAPPSADGPQHVIPAAPGASGKLRFDVAGLRRVRIVSAWLQHRRDRRWLSVRAVSRAAGLRALRVRRPAGWQARHTLLVVRTPSRAGVHGCGFGGFRVGVWPRGCWRPYSVKSPFNRPLPSSPRVAADSDRVVARLLGFGRVQHLAAGLADTKDDYGHPVYYSRPQDPLFRLHCHEKSWGTCSIERHEIRVPAAARPAAGDDAHLTVVDQDRGWEYDLYNVRSKPPGGGLLEFQWGGRTRIDGDGLRSSATAAGFGNLAGIVRAAELASGRIDHALFLGVYCDSGRFVYPAYGRGRSCSQLGLPTDTAPAMGARFQLAMSAEEIKALRVPAWKKTILHAMATYGMFVGDTGGGSWGLKMESGSTFTSFGYRDPLVRFAQSNGWTPWERVWVGNLRDGVDWTRLRLIDPCVTHRSC